MGSLRHFLSDAHQRAFLVPGIIDREVSDPLNRERLHRFQTQLVAAYALHSALDELQIPVDQNLLDLRPLVELAQRHQMISHIEARILLRINKLANEAKHQRVFESRL